MRGTFDRARRGDGRQTLADVVAGMSCALDVAEGQPEGHAARSCMIGMRVARELSMDPARQAELFYALLLKDLGGSSNASVVCSTLGADDRRAKRAFRLVDWARPTRSARYVARNVMPHRSILRRVGRLVRLGVARPGRARALFYARCERGARLARELQLPEASAEAIRSLDEHWDGRGQPGGLRGHEIPLASRVMALAQTAEVFFTGHGVGAAFAMAAARSGTWFDPEVVRAFRSLRNDDALWTMLRSGDAHRAVVAYEPGGVAAPADDAALDRIACAFGAVADAKSPWTKRHSAAVAEVAEGLAGVMQLPAEQCRLVRRAALLHDVGKLAISNLILDKPGKLTPAEAAEVRTHPAHTRRLLARVGAFRDVAATAAAHHERPDGTGYPLGLAGAEMELPARILAVANTFEALAARRPYRQDLTRDEVMAVLARDAGAGLCPVVLEALKAWLAVSRFQPVILRAA